jgi:dihydrofolate reductase
MHNYVFSRKPGKAPAPNIEFVNEEIEAFAKRVKRGKGKNVWLVGGSEVIASFLDHGQIDEFIIHVMPLFIGEGIPLIQPRHRDVPLKLLKIRRYSDGVIRLHYRVA